MLGVHNFSYICNMKIRIEPHTLQRAVERGITESEIKNTIVTGRDILAKGGRLAKEKIFNFNNVRNGIFYKEKRI